MYQGSAKVLAPAFVVIFAVVLLGLILAGPRVITPAPAPAPGVRVEPTALPWAPLYAPSADLRAVSSLLNATPDRERAPALGLLASDRTLSPLTRGLAAFAAGVHHLEKKQSRRAVEQFESRDIAATELGGYALHYIARELESTNPERALEALGALEAGFPQFTLMDEARLRYARLLRARGDRESAIKTLEPITLGRDETSRGEALDEVSKLFVDLRRYQDAVDALETLYYELPRHERANNAGRRLTRLRKKLPEVPPSHLYALGLRRAELLMDKRRYRDDYNGFASLLTRYSKVADRDLVRLRMATCQYRRRQITASLSNFKRVTREALVPEALFYRAEVARRLRHKKTHLARVAELEARYPESEWTEAALWSLANHLASNDEPEEALVRYRQIVTQFPRGKHALEANWRLHWESFANGRFEEAGFGFEETAREQPGSDALPRLLYWAGRSYQEAGQFDRGDALFRQVLLGYQNSYYGRRAVEHLAQMHGAHSSVASLEGARKGIDLSGALRVERVRRQQRVAQLFAVGLPKRALQEAEAAVRGERDDAAFRAMAAWIYSRQGSTLDTIITIRQAFPFYVSATGDLLPRPIWELFYPLPFREHVERYATARGLDPFLVAALIRQESTFNPRVRSRAGARGLMQIIPSTGRLLARQERRRYSTRDLYNPEINIRYGTRYLKSILGRFNGRVDYALASYNAGPHRVKRWTGMDMTIDPEVFIEEIPFDETRAYVKLVLRNEMLYRRLYGEGTEALAKAPAP